MIGRATLVRTVLLVIVMATSMFNVNAFMTSPSIDALSSLKIANNMNKGAQGHGTKLFVDVASAGVGSGMDFVESMTHAWESYNLALENDPLVTKWVWIHY